MLKIDGLDVVQESGVTVIAIGSRFSDLDDTMMNELRDPFVAAGKAADPPVVLIDLAHTQFFGTVFIEAVFQIWGHIETIEGGRLGLCSLTEHCREVVEVTRLTKLWGVFETREDGIASLSEPQG